MILARDDGSADAREPSHEFDAARRLNPVDSARSVRCRVLMHTYGTHAARKPDPDDAVLTAVAAAVS